MTSISANNTIIQQFSDASGVPANGRNNNNKAVILFTADWHEACAVGGAMDQLLTAIMMATHTASPSPPTNEEQPLNNNTIMFGRCDAEENPAMTEKYAITAVPTFCLIHGDVVVDRIVGGDDAAAVTVAVQRLVHASSSNGINSGTADPATAATPIIATETHNKDPLEQRLNRLIRSADVMIFMKGTPSQPKCGFSRQVVEMLEDENIQFASFDILTDDVVRQGLKTHSNWPTYPQIYVKGELIGGLDILKEMKEEGPSSLAAQFGVTAPSLAVTSIAPTAASLLQDRLKGLVHRSPVMLFMKGLPSAPKCGFSRQLVQLLEDAGCTSYDAFDILTDEEVRQGLKEYSDWPTYPQLYVSGELIGGLDIVKEMHDDGSLKDALGAGIGS